MRARWRRTSAACAVRGRRRARRRHGRLLAGDRPVLARRSPRRAARVVRASSTRGFARRSGRRCAQRPRACPDPRGRRGLVLRRARGRARRCASSSRRPTSLPPASCWPRERRAELLAWLRDTRRSRSRTTTTPSSATTARPSGRSRASRRTTSSSRAGDQDPRARRCGSAGWSSRRHCTRRSPRRSSSPTAAPRRIDQLALAHFIARGALDRHLRRMRSPTAAAATRSSPRFPPPFRTPPAGHRGRASTRQSSCRAGLHRRRRCSAEAPPPAASHWRSTREQWIDKAVGPPTLLLGFAHVSEAAMPAGVRELAAAVEDARSIV